MRVLNGVFIAIFMAMLTLPLVFVNLSSDRVSVQENRMLAPCPKLADIKNHPETFIRDFDAWFKDSTGFKEQLVSLYNVMGKNTWFNGFWYKDGQYTYLIGEQGHHYFADVDGALISKYQGKQFVSDEQLTHLAVGLEEVKAYLDKQGIPLVVMICTDKESIYPEFYPKSITRGSEPIQLDEITGYLQEHTTVDVFNIRQALVAEKDNFLLYYIIDTMSFTADFAHYNQIGAFFAYRELMRYINKYFPQIISYELNDVDICYDEKERPHVSLKQKKLYRKLDQPFFDDAGYACENTESGLPVILFMRDSYAAEEYIGKYIAQQFGKAIFIPFPYLENFEEYIDKYKPDIVVFESSERGFEYFSECVSRIPITDLELKYIDHIPIPSESIGININDIHSLNVVDDNLTLYCGDIDPQIYFPVQEQLSKPFGNPYIEIECTNNKLGTLQVFYDFGGGFSEENSVRQYIGELSEMTKICLRIVNWQAGSNLYSIRIDPPDGTVFVIKSIVLSENEQI